MAGSINRKLSTRSVEQEGILDFLNLELKPLVMRIMLLLGQLTTLVKSGAGDPEGVVAAGVGSIYLRTDGGAGTTLYVKESGDSNTSTGWVAK